MCDGRKTNSKLFNDDGMGSRAWRSEYKGRFDNKWTDDDDEDLATLGRAHVPDPNSEAILTTAAATRATC